MPPTVAHCAIKPACTEPTPRGCICSSTWRPPCLLALHCTACKDTTEHTGTHSNTLTTTNPEVAQQFRIANTPPCITHMPAAAHSPHACAFAAHRTQMQFTQPHTLLHLQAPKHSPDSNTRHLYCCTCTAALEQQQCNLQH
jgi:hypothetical protein